MSQQIRIGSAKRLELLRQRDLLDLILSLAVFIPVFIFVLDGGLVGIDSLTAAISSFNRVVALVGTSILLIHMLLVARLSWIESVLGLDGATTRHKKLGRPLIYILMLHMLLSVTHYSFQSGVNIGQGLIDLNLSYFEIGLSTIALGLMIFVAYSSAVSIRKKISYESWQAIHILSYLAVLIAIPHQFVFGTDFLAQPWMTTFFMALYLFVFGNILWFRIGKPLTQSFGLRVSEVVQEKNNTTSVYIDGKRLRKIHFEAGQFFMLRVFKRGMWLQSHPFSVSSSPDEDRLRFTIGARGDFTEQIASLKPGTRVSLDGPFGIFSEKTRTHRELVMIAAGIGVAPVRSLARSVVSEEGDVTIIYRVNDSNDAALLEELEEISKTRGHRLIVLEGDRQGDSWLPGENSVPDYARLIEIAPNVLNSDIYICGPAAWANSVQKTLSKLNLDKQQVHAEEFAW